MNSENGSRFWSRGLRSAAHYSRLWKGAVKGLLCSGASISSMMPEADRVTAQVQNQSDLTVCKRVA